METARVCLALPCGVQWQCDSLMELPSSWEFVDLKWGFLTFRQLGIRTPSSVMEKWVKRI